MDTTFFSRSQDDVSKALEYARQYFDSAEKMGDLDGMVQIAVPTYQVWFLDGRFIEIYDASRRILRLSEERPTENHPDGLHFYSTNMGFHGTALSFLGNFAEARDVFWKGLEKAHQKNDVFRLGLLEYMYCICIYLEGDGGALINHARKAIRHLREIGVGVYMGSAWSFLGIGHFFLGESWKAKGYAEKGLMLSDEMGFPAYVPLIHVFLSMILQVEGDLEYALKHAEEGLRLARECKSRLFEADAVKWLGRIKAQIDPSRLGDALLDIRQGISMNEEMQNLPGILIGYLILGEALEIAGNTVEALDNLQKTEEMSLQMGMDNGYWITRTREAVARLT